MVIRENAELLARANFVPIVEPVKDARGGLNRCVEAVVEANGEIVLIINPKKGKYLKKDGKKDEFNATEFLATDLGKNDKIRIGLLLTNDETCSYVEQNLGLYGSRRILLIHSGFGDAKELAERLVDNPPSNVDNLFIEGFCGKLYQKRFQFGDKVLLRDGFLSRTNKEYPKLEFFSDLHITYELESMDGFGDYSIVGDTWRDGGGPAYAIAIHLTCIDPEDDNQMYVHHFISDTNETPTDPAGKFREALSKLIREVNREGSLIETTKAVEEFKSLDKRAHYPGLGIVKKLSMQHHIETLNLFFKNK